MGDYAKTACGTGELRYFKGVIIASLTAGPIVALPPIAVAIVVQPDDWGRSIGAMAGVLLFALPIGFIVSFLPNLIGAMVLARIGRTNIAARLPILWLLAGAGLGAALGIVWESATGSTVSGGAAAVVAVVGATNAGICRWFTRWQD